MKFVDDDDDDDDVFLHRQLLVLVPGA